MLYTEGRIRSTKASFTGTGSGFSRLETALCVAENAGMARPLRSLTQVRTVVVRRRHRTWMLSMICATLGWGVWWMALALRRWAPDWAPSLDAAGWLAGAIAVFGLLVAIWTIRAKAAWLLITLVPLFANASLLAMPMLVESLRSR